MKKILLAITLLPFLGNAQNDNFNGVWKHMNSEYALHINLNDLHNKRIFLYNRTTNDTLHKTLVYETEKELMSRVTATDGIYYVKYNLINDELHGEFQEFDYTVVYKRQ